MRSVSSQPIRKSRRPSDDEWSLARHGDYIAKASGTCAIETLSTQLYWLCELAGHLSPVSLDTIHKPYGWTIREVFSHGLDAERHFGLRMLQLAAGDVDAMQPFDEQAYVSARYGLGNFTFLVSEWGALRQSNLYLLQRIRPGCWNHRGSIEGHTLTLRALAWVTAGHLQHHLDIVETRIGFSVDHEPPRA